jgi:hypothetical protein
MLGLKRTTLAAKLRSLEAGTAAAARVSRLKNPRSARMKTALRRSSSRAESHLHQARRHWQTGWPAPARPRDSPVEAYGTVDELNAVVGMAYTSAEQNIGQDLRVGLCSRFCSTSRLT